LQSWAFSLYHGNKFKIIYTCKIKIKFFLYKKLIHSAFYFILMCNACAYTLRFYNTKTLQNSSESFSLNSNWQVAKTLNMKKISLLQTHRTMWGTYNFPHIHHVSFITKRNMTTASITTVLNFIISVFVLITLVLHFVPCLFFSLQSSDIYLFRFKRGKRKKVRLKRFY